MLQAPIASALSLLPVSMITLGQCEIHHSRSGASLLPLRPLCVYSCQIEFCKLINLTLVSPPQRVGYTCSLSRTSMYIS